MTFKASIASGVLLAFALGTSALAQTAQPAAQPARPAIAPGPAIAGVCAYNNEQTIQQSRVGQSVSTRLQQLNQAVQAELQPQATALQTEVRTIEALPQDQRQARLAPLQQRLQAFEQLQQLRAAELQRTQQVQIVRIAQAIDPILAAVIQERNCGLVLDRQQLFHINPAMDLTPTVIQRLDATIQSLTFERERINPQQPQQPAQ